jgi:multidrug efflux pump subunit AcrA (membrane-fusion protein)
LKVKELDHDLEKARQALTDAKGALKRYVEGAGPLMLKEYESKVALAERDLLLAREKLDFKLRVNEDPTLNSPYSQNEIKAERLTVAKLELSLEQARSDLTMFKQYDHPRSIRQLQADVEQAKLNLERAEVTARTQKLIAETNEKTREQNLLQAQQKLKELLEQESKLIVKAEADGLVAYDTGRGWRADQVTVAVGESIRPRQQLMIIPDMTSLQIRTRVYEAVISMIETGQPAVIRLDSRPEVAMTGKVAKVDVLPSSQHRWLNPGVKVFDVVVKFDSPEVIKSLKPGLTAQVTIQMRRLDDVLSVPIAAIFTEQEQTFCHVVRNGQVEKVNVTVGQMNETHVEIRDGLAEGEEVLLVSPSGGSKTSEEGKGKGGETAPGGNGGGGPRG